MMNDETSPNVGIKKAALGLTSALVFRHSFVIRHLSFVICLAVAGSLLAAPPPSAQEILESVRMLESRQQLNLDGQLRENDNVIPFHLTQTGSRIRYSFSEPEEVLELRLSENGSRLDLVTEEGSEKVPAEKLNEKIRGTGVTYGDLALKFLYWPNGRVLGDETVHARSCWKLQLAAPSRDSQYANIFLWVDKRSGALMRMEGYDVSGRLSKRFEVVSTQKIDNRWFLKQMRVEEMQPGTNKVQARTYLEIKK
jgi:outer membrane lipoprotein-sorting protein